LQKQYDDSGVLGPKALVAIQVEPKVFCAVVVTPSNIILISLYTTIYHHLRLAFANLYLVMYVDTR